MFQSLARHLHNRSYAMNSDNKKKTCCEDKRNNIKALYQVVIPGDNRIWWQFGCKVCRDTFGYGLGCYYTG